MIFALILKLVVTRGNVHKINQFFKYCIGLDYGLETNDKNEYIDLTLLLQYANLVNAS